MTPAEEAVKVAEELVPGAQPAPEVGEEVKQNAPCARCGWSAETEVGPLESDLEEYMRCVLGGKAFTKEYEMYGGQIKLTYRSVNNREVDALNDLLFKMADHMDHAVIQDKSIKLKLLYFLSKVQLAEEAADYAIPTFTEYDQIDNEFNARFGSCAEPIIRMMSQTLILFMELQGMLINQGFDENFWKGAGLHSR